MQSVLDHVLANVEKTDIQTDPYPHIIITGLFPPEFYEKVVQELDDISSNKNIFNVFHKPSQKKKNNTRTEVCIVDENIDTTLQNDYFDFALMKKSEIDFNEKVKGTNMGIVCEVMTSDKLKDALMAKFSTYLADRMVNKTNQQICKKIRLNRDTSGFKLTPHTDTEFKLLFGVLYLAKDSDNAHLGTDMYKHKDGLKSWRTTPLDVKLTPDQFIKVKQASYLPNNFAVFLKNDESWHGVCIDKCEIVRHTMYYSLCDL